MKYIIVIVFSVFVFSSSILAQDNKIVKSEVVKEISGKKYYIHTVKKGETIYSICKAYNVTEKQLAVENPDIFNGLKLNQELKILIHAKAVAQKSDDYIYFNIKGGQTVYSITKQYKITKEQFYEYNPEAKKGLLLGQEVRIKKEVKKVEITHEVKPTDVPYVKHKVKRKETLYSISKKYNVSQDEIIRANPSIKENGLKKGVIINIPTKEFINNSLWEKKDTISVDTVAVADSLNMMIDTIAVNCDEINFDKAQTIKIGLFLPFDLDIKTLEIEQKRLDTDSKKIRPKTKPFFELYQGVLLKLQEFKKQGYNVDLYTYDTKKSVYTVKQLALKPELGNLDFIIGPVYKNTFDTLLKYRPQNIPVINPIIDVSSGFNSNYSFIQLESSKEVLFNKITDYISKLDSVNYIIIYDGSEEQASLVWKYSEKLRKLKEDSIVIHKVDFSKNDKLEKFVSKDKPNIVIISSVKEGFVTNIVTKLHVASLEDSVILIGFKEWLRFKIQTEYYHNLSLTLFTNDNINYYAKNVTLFNKQYLDEYKSEASKYSFIGYDVASLFVNSFIKYKHNLCNCLNKTEFKGVIYSPNFVKYSNVYVNTHFNMVQYKKDLTVEIK